MGDRDQIVHEIERPNARVFYPGGEAGVVQACMADVQVEPALGALLPSSGGTEDVPDQPGADICSRRREDLEQLPGRLAVEDPAKARMMDDGLRARTKMLEISQTDPVDARRMAAGPPAPNQPGDIEQKWRVVRQGFDQRMVLRTVATGSTEDARMFTKRCKSDNCELAMYMTSPSRTPKRCAAKWMSSARQ